MSGPVSSADAPPDTASEAPVVCQMEVLDGRAAEVGGFGVRRVLPRRQRRAVGPWCFVDHMGPGQITADRGLDVGPHPHIGLQTVTWLLEGAVLHRDSLGSEQLIRPGQLNLMTAGQGVSHSEETTGIVSGALHGVQLWVAQPESTRHRAPAFEHHPVLPQAEAGDGVVTVLVGSYLGAVSPARRDTDHLGAELQLPPGRTTLPLDAAFEHALVALDDAVTVDGRRLEPGRLGYLGVGRDEVALDLDQATRVLLIGGAPLEEPLLMWWNYVARTRGEIIDAHHDWSSGSARFGTVRSPLGRIDVDGPPWASATS